MVAEFGAAALPADLLQQAVQALFNDPGAAAGDAAAAAPPAWQANIMQLMVQEQQQEPAPGAGSKFCWLDPPVLAGGGGCPAAAAPLTTTLRVPADTLAQLAQGDCRLRVVVTDDSQQQRGLAGALVDTSFDPQQADWPQDGTVQVRAWVMSEEAHARCPCASAGRHQARTGCARARGCLELLAVGAGAAPAFICPWLAMCAWDLQRLSRPARAAVRGLPLQISIPADCCGPLLRVHVVRADPASPQHGSDTPLHVLPLLLLPAAAGGEVAILWAGLVALALAEGAANEHSAAAEAYAADFMSFAYELAFLVGAGRGEGTDASGLAQQLFPAAQQRHQAAAAAHEAMMQYLLVNSMPTCAQLLAASLRAGSSKPAAGATPRSLVAGSGGGGSADAAVGGSTGHGAAPAAAALAAAPTAASAGQLVPGGGLSWRHVVLGFQPAAVERAFCQWRRGRQGQVGRMHVGAWRRGELAMLSGTTHDPCHMGPCGACGLLQHCRGTAVAVAVAVAVPRQCLMQQHPTPTCTWHTPSGQCHRHARQARV